MAGWLTNGVPNASTATGSLPLNSAVLIPAEYAPAGGIAPIDVTVTPAMLAAAGNGSQQTLTYAANMSFDASTGNFFQFTFGAGNTTLTFSNFNPGQVVVGKVTQDGTGSRTITVGNAGSLKSGTPLSTPASSIDLVAFMNVGTLASPVIYYWPIAKAFA